MKNNLSTAVLQTLTYHSLFNYPVTAYETYKYLSGCSASQTEVKKELTNSPRIILKGNRYYLKGQSYQSFRPQSSTTAWQFLNKAQHFTLRNWKSLKGLQLIAVSGSTAALHTPYPSDIDVMGVVDSDNIWLTRLLMLLKLSWKNERVDTKKNLKQNHSKICLNLLLADDQLTIPKNLRDLYTAMEIAHLKVIYNRHQTFERFLAHNNWIKGYLPNFWQICSQEWLISSASREKSKVKTSNILYHYLDGLARQIQKSNYKLRHQRELKLGHYWEKNHRQEILKRYQQKIDQLISI